MRPRPIALTLALLPGLVLASEEWLYVASCEEAAAGPRVEAVARWGQGSNPEALPVGTVGAPSALVRQLGAMSWYGLTPSGKSLVVAPGSFAHARNVFAWNEPGEGDEPLQPGDPGFDSALLVLGACREVGTVYSTVPLHSLKPRPLLGPIPPVPSPQDPESPPGVQLSAQGVGYRDPWPFQVIERRLDYPMPELPWIKEKTTHERASLELWTRGASAPAFSTEGASVGFPVCVSLDSRPETLCLGSVSHSKPEAGSTQEAAVVVVVAPDGTLHAAELETGGSGC